MGQPVEPDWASTLDDRCSAAWHHARVPARFSGLRLATSPLLGGRCAGLVRRLIIPPMPEEDGARDDWSRLWNRSWYLWGPLGVGKTGLAVGYAYQLVDPAFGEPARIVFWSVPDLLGAIRATYAEHAPRRERGTEASILSRCLQADLLVLDDIGAEHVTGSGWVEDRLYRIVGGRHAEMLPILFTSNCSLEELAARIGERIAWRIVEMCGKDGIVKVTGPNLRDR